MSFSQSFAYDGLTVRAECPDQAHLTWLREFLFPTFAEIADDTVDRTVTLEIDDRRHAELMSAGPHHSGQGIRGFVLDRGPVDLKRWSSPSRERVLFDTEAVVFYCVDPHTSLIRIVSASRYLSRRLALMRVVREFAMSASWTRTRFVLHAAACAFGDSAVLIAGPKGAGKTTLLMHALGIRDAKFIANDRVVVDVGGSQATARGIPTVVTVREQTLRCFPTFAERAESSGYEERLSLHEAGGHRVSSQRAEVVRLTPAQFRTLLGVPASGPTRARALVFPRIAADIEGMRLEELSPQAASRRLAASIFAAGSPQISEVFAAANHSAAPHPAIVSELSRALISQIRCFDCVLGQPTPHTAESISDFLTMLLRTS